MKMKKSILVCALALALSIGANVTAYSHSGGTNASGCHNVWKDGKIVGYHCHVKKTG